MELKNKVVVITGGTRGLGKALAFSFIKNNAHVVICAKKEEELDGLSKEGILGIRADVTKENDLNNFLEVVKEKFKNVDLWINNAGIWLPHASIEEIDWNRAHDLLEVNLFGTVYGSKIALIQMRKQGFGSIINILSTSALEGREKSSAYCASKYAADGFTKSLRKEVEGTNIKVISVYPGGMQTELFDEKKPENYEEYMDPSFVANKIIENLKKETPEEELIIKCNI
jgi:short-subunit dehydrogenase